MDNADTARIFEEVANLLEIQDESPFRVRAYRGAARTLGSLGEPAAELVEREGISALTELPGIGKDNAQPERLDLCDSHVRLSKETGAKLVVASDAHAVAELDFMRYGIDQARRGWCTAADIANTAPRSELLELIGRRRRAASSRGAVHPTGALSAHISKGRNAS